MFQKHFDRVREINREASFYRSMEGLFRFDQWTALPEAGGPWRQEVRSFMDRQLRRLYADDDARQAARYFSQTPPAELSDLQRGHVRLFLRQYKALTALPPELTRQYNALRPQALKSWKEAKAASDYRIFAPWLEKAFELKKAMALAMAPDRPAFDTLIDQTDEGVTPQELFCQFDALKAGIARLLGQIPRRETALFVKAPYAPEALAKAGTELAFFCGLHPERVTIRTNAPHGVTNRPGPRDSRIALCPSPSLSLIFTMLHEGAHAMYSSRTGEDLADEGFWGGIPGSMHEGIARFYENMIGKSLPFWQSRLPLLQERLPALKSLAAQEFCAGFRSVIPSWQRTSADEVTYSLHIILRSELERDLLSGTLQAQDLAEAWNEKSEQLLGFRPESDAQGLLQDMHWAGDYIGYFQSYALGNIWGGQILEALQKDRPDAFSALKEGDMTPIDGWMQEHIFRHGCLYTAPELMARVTGSPHPDARPFLRYLEQRYAGKPAD